MPGDGRTGSGKLGAPEVNRLLRLDDHRRLRGRQGQWDRERGRCDRGRRVMPLRKSAATVCIGLAEGGTSGSMMRVRLVHRALGVLGATRHPCFGGRCPADAEPHVSRREGESRQERREPPTEPQHLSRMRDQTVCVNRRGDSQRGGTRSTGRRAPADLRAKRVVLPDPRPPNPDPRNTRLSSRRAMCNHASDNVSNISLLWGEGLGTTLACEER
jgi:hypothetical protein